MHMNAVWIILSGISFLHLYWAAGGLWPGKTRRELSAKVIGDRPLPGTVPCLLVAGALLIGPWFFPKLSAGVFLLRGIVGFFEVHLRPAIRGTPYQNLSYWIYSPLSLLIGWALWP